MLTTTAPRIDLHAKRYFLTYAQCDVKKEDLRDFLREVHGATWYVIGKEMHKDEGEHLHAYVEWTEQKRVRDPRLFDFRGHHPNVQTVRSPVKCQAYCIKDGDYIANMEVAEGRRTYGTIIKGAVTKEEFLVQVEDAYPRDMVLHLDRIKSFADYKYGGTRTAYENEFSGFVVPETLTQWYEDNVVCREPGR